jgi:hypothetical protein
MSDRNMIFFHIGTHKTGSTALQKFFVENADVLLYKGYSYAGYNDAEMNHGYLINPKLWQQVELSKGINHIISGEDFYKKILDLKSVVDEKLKEFDVRFVIYLKRQDLMKQSVYNQIVKMHGYCKSIEEDNHYDLDYCQFLKDLEIVYPDAKINVRVYEKGRFKGGSIYSDFLGVLGLELTNEFNIPDGVINPSLTRDKLEFCRYINMLELPIGLRTQINKSVVKLALDSDEVQLFRKQDFLAPEAALKIVKNFEQGNSYIAGKYLGCGDGKLFYDPLPDPAGEQEPYLGLPDDVAKKIVEEVYRISPDVLHDLLNYLKDKNPASNESKVAKSFVVHLVMRQLALASLGSNFNFPEIQDVISSLDSKTLLGLASKLKVDSEPADILREVAFSFEQSGDIKTACKVMEQAHYLRPQGPLIKQKLDEYWQKLDKQKSSGTSL